MPPRNLTLNFNGICRLSLEMTRLLWSLMSYPEEHPSVSAREVTKSLTCTFTFRKISPVGELDGPLWATKGGFS